MINTGSAERLRLTELSEPRPLAAATLGSDQPDRLMRPRCRVILVSRDRTLALDLCRGLGSVGFAVHPAYSIGALRHLLARITPRLAVIDTTTWGSAAVAELEAAVADAPGLLQVDAVLLGRPASVAGPGAPLALARSCSLAELTRALEQQLETSAHERRVPRFAAHLPLWLRDQGRNWRAVTLNLSRRGMLVSCPCALPLGTEVEVILPDPETDLEVHGTCRVVYVGAHGPDDQRISVGLEFIDLSPAAEAVLIDLVGRVAGPPPPVGSTPDDERLRRTG